MNQFALHPSWAMFLLNFSFYGALQRVMSNIEDTVRGVVTHLQVGRTVRHLQSLDDAMLADIGVDRRDIAAVVRGAIDVRR